MFTNFVEMSASPLEKSEVPPPPSRRGEGCAHIFPVKFRSAELFPPFPPPKEGGSGCPRVCIPQFSI